MCAIFGEINIKNDKWVSEQKEQALKRGKDLTTYGSKNFRFYHTRLATNNSKDEYPIKLDDATFAMNGIVSAGYYDMLMQSIPTEKMYGYTVDSAYFLRLYLDKKDWKIFDSNDFVFAFWMLKDNKLYLGNKDFPLFYNKWEDQIKFSSFKGNGMIPVDNKVIEFDINTGFMKELIQFEDLIYA